MGLIFKIETQIEINFFFFLEEPELKQHSSSNFMCETRNQDNSNLFF